MVSRFRCNGAVLRRDSYVEWHLSLSVLPLSLQSWLLFKAQGLNYGTGTCDAFVDMESALGKESILARV